MLSGVCNIIVLQLSRVARIQRSHDAIFFPFVEREAVSLSNGWTESENRQRRLRQRRTSEIEWQIRATNRCRGFYFIGDFSLCVFDDARKESVTNKLIISFILIHSLTQRGDLFSFLILAEMLAFTLYSSADICVCERPWIN